MSSWPTQHSELRDRLVATAAEAGAADPDSLGRQLAVIFEGANALAASTNDAQAFTDARRAAKTLLDTALITTPQGERVQPDIHLESKETGDDPARPRLPQEAADDQPDSWPQWRRSSGWVGSVTFRYLESRGSSSTRRATGHPSRQQLT